METLMKEEFKPGDAVALTGDPYMAVVRLCNSPAGDPCTPSPCADRNESESEAIL